jgi:hypothetical protein
VKPSIRLVLRRRSVIQILSAAIGWIAIFVAYVLTFGSRSNEREGDKDMNADVRLTLAINIHIWIRVGIRVPSRAEHATTHELLHTGTGCNVAIHAANPTEIRRLIVRVTRYLSPLFHQASSVR